MADEDYRAVRYGHAVVENGSQAWFTEPITLNNSGRNLQAQCQLEMESRIRRMCQRGYKSTREEAIASGGLNQNGRPMPMLAHPIKRVAVRQTARMWSQPKFDGHRALTNHDGLSRDMYSRKGTSISAVGSVAHLMPTIEAVCPPDITLDGELYIHGVRLQDIGSFVKQKQPNSLRLEYIVYDVVMPEPYSVRFEVLCDIVRLLNQRCEQIDGASTREISDISEAVADFGHFRGLGYEGSMLRLDGEAYRPGVRSSSLLKLKEREEAEFEITGVREVKNGLANLLLKAANGRAFETLAPGTHEEKAKFLVDEALWRGKHATCEYPYLTADGIPFHCICTRVREDV